MLVSLLMAATLSANVPPMPHRDAGACPFECCTYRDWRTEKPVTLHATTTLKSSVVAEIAAGVTVTADTGVVITSRYGVTKILKPIDLGYLADNKTPALRLKAGEEIYTLHYAGEGYDNFWYRGKVYEDQISDDGPSIRIVSKPVYAWWARIRTPDGKVGWTSQTDRFSNQDSCG